MAERKIKPNIKTLNSVLESLSKMNTSKNAKTYALQTIAEFKSLNIEPSLASFYYLLEICSRNSKFIFSIQLFLTGKKILHVEKF